MKKIFLFVALFFLLFPAGVYSQNSQQVEVLTPTKIITNNAKEIIDETPSKQQGGIFDVMSEIEVIENNITQLESSIEYDTQELTEMRKQGSVIEDIYTKLINIYNTIIAQQPDDFQNLPLELESRFDLYILDFYSELGIVKEVKIPSLTESLNNNFEQINGDYLEYRDAFGIKEQEKINSITSQEEQIEELKGELTRKRSMLSELTLATAKRFGRFFAVIILLIISSKVFQWGIEKKYYLTNDKSSVLRRAIKWFFNFAIVLTVLLFFFSEFTRFLPFLAILGTAIGFALRDIISSIIAWFMLGYRESIYKIGDIIQIESENLFGKVLRVTPTVTIIREMGLSGRTGSEKNFPNKFIFEKTIKNRSKFDGWTFIALDFFLDPEEDLDTFEKILIESVDKCYEAFHSPRPEDNSQVFLAHGLTSDSLQPKVYYEYFPYGIRIRLKALFFLSEIIAMKSYLNKEIIVSAKEHKIQFKKLSMMEVVEK